MFWLGATLDRMAAGEHQADKGEVVVAPEILAQLGDKLAITEFREDEESGLCFAVATALTSPVVEMPWSDISTIPLTEDQSRPWLLPSVYERLRSGQGRFLAEIRPAVALFMRFGGIDYDQDEAAGEKLDSYIRWVQDIIATYEGALIQLTLGDKGCYLYAAYGAPLAHDDDPARAVATALKLQTPPPRLSFIEPVQIGISRGQMRAGAYGGAARRTYGVLGDEVNMAARLMSHAKPGQIVVSKRVADAVETVYQVDDLGLIQVKGKVEPLHVFQVLGSACSLPVTQHLFHRFSWARN